MLITRQIGELSNLKLRDNLIDVYLTKRKIVKNAIEDFVYNKLELVIEPTRKIGTEQVQNKNLKDPGT